MIEPVPLLFSLVIGFIAGLFFFGALYWTVRRIPHVQRPGLLLVVSFVVRTAAVLGIFYLVMDSSWQRLVAAVLGFILARSVLVHKVRPKSKTDGSV